MAPPLELLIVGRTGNGMSATANRILDRKEFDVYNRSDQGGVQKRAERLVHGQAVSIYDGVRMSRMESEVKEYRQGVLERLSRAFSEMRNRLTALVFVLKYGSRFTSEESEIVDALLCMFGGDVFQKHGVCVFTHGDKFQEDMKDEGTPQKTFERWCEEQGGGVKRMIDECENRVVLFDNKTKDKDIKHRQRKQLLFYLQQVNSKPYTKEDFDGAAYLRKAWLASEQTYADIGASGSRKSLENSSYREVSSSWKYEEEKRYSRSDHHSSPFAKLGQHDYFVDVRSEERGLASGGNFSMDSRVLKWDTDPLGNDSSSTGQTSSRDPAMESGLRNGQSPLGSYGGMTQMAFGGAMGGKTSQEHQQDVRLLILGSESLVCDVGNFLLDKQAFRSVVSTTSRQTDIRGKAAKSKPGQTPLGRKKVVTGRATSEDSKDPQVGTAVRFGGMHISVACIPKTVAGRNGSLRLRGDARQVVTQGGFDALVIVLQYQFPYLEAVRELMEAAKEVFGSGVTKDRTILGFVRDLKSEMRSVSDTQFKNWYRKLTGELQKWFNECNNRCVLLNVESSSQDERMSQAKMLVYLARSLCETSGRYSTDEFRDVERRLTSKDIQDFKSRFANIVQNQQQKNLARVETLRAEMVEWENVTRYSSSESEELGDLYKDIRNLINIQASIPKALKSTKTCAEAISKSTLKKTKVGKETGVKTWTTETPKTSTTSWNLNSGAQVAVGASGGTSTFEMQAESKRTQLVKDLNQQLPPSFNLNVLLVGNVGNGKTSTANSILGSKTFHSKTPSWQMETVELKKNRLVTVVDMPGIEESDSDPGSSREKYARNMEQVVEMMSQHRRDSDGSVASLGFQALLLVLAYGERFTLDQREAVRAVKCVFGEGALREYGVLVFTGGDRFQSDIECDEEDSEEEDEKTFTAWCRRQGGEIRALMSECEYRCVLFDNKTKDNLTQERQRLELLVLVNQLKTVVVGRPYSQESLNSARKQGQTWILEEKMAKLEERTDDTLLKIRDKLDLILERSKDNEDPSRCILALENVLNDLESWDGVLKIEDGGTRALSHLTMRTGSLIGVVTTHLAHLKTERGRNLLLVEKEREHIRELHRYQHEHQAALSNAHSLNPLISRQQHSLDLQFSHGLPYNHGPQYNNGQNTDSRNGQMTRNKKHNRRP